MVSDFRRGEPGRFEVAVWSGQILCGLAIGRTRTEYCRVDYLEGSPDPVHPLKGNVVVVVAGAVVAYATALGKREVRLVDPLPAVVAHYEALGFKLANPKGASPYCWREIRRSHEHETTPTPRRDALHSQRGEKEGARG
jgi:hypothetical protein